MVVSRNQVWWDLRPMVAAALAAAVGDGRSLGSLLLLLHLNLLLLLLLLLLLILLTTC